MISTTPSERTVAAKHQSRSGSALIIVLSVTVILALLVANFSADLNNELKAAGDYYAESINTELSRTAFALARIEINQSGAQLYANGHGDAYLVAGSEDYETVIEELQTYRNGYELGRGMASYQLVYTPYALDTAELSQDAWQRLFEVGCGMDDGTERSELVDCIIDWIDSDSNARTYGMEEEDYQDLDVPRHAKNGSLENDEELMLVYGITPEMYYGYGYPLYEEDGMLWGGGLQRYLIGDNSPEGRASSEYITQGTYPDDNISIDEDEELEYEKVNVTPERLYLIAKGYDPEPAEEESISTFSDGVTVSGFNSQRIMVVKLKLAEGNEASYEIDQLIENASGELVDRILAYGIAEEDEF